jgi:hypothetical protein
MVNRSEMKSVLRLAIMILLIAMISGCIQVQSPKNVTPVNVSPSITSPPVATTPVFPRNPIDLEGKVQVPGPVGSFEQSYIGSPDCPAVAEAKTYGTSYDFISGSGGPFRVRFQLIPVVSEWDLNETPMPKEILYTVITPDEFIAQPDHLYTLRVEVTVGPSLYDAFRLRAFVDGVPAPEADDTLVVFNDCYYTPGGYPGDGGHRQGSFLSFDENGITMLPGDERDVNLTLQNSDGGIRELSLRIVGLTLPSFFKNMTVSFDPPVTIAHNFWDDHVTMHITTRPQMPAGEYSIPLRLCMRSLDPSNPTGSHFPFTEGAYCPSADFNVRITSYREGTK